MNKTEFIELLNKHDWFFEYTDDFKVWNDGHGSLAYILKVCQDYPELYDVYREYRDNMLRRAV